MTQAAELSGARALPHRFLVLALLFLVYTFNFIDRQILGILAGPIQEELGLTDTQLGWLGGPAFAIFYSVVGVPIALYADRANRTWIMTIALSAWSAFTALCAFAGSFMQLFLARIGVGVGEAGGVAPSYSLIADYFPKHERARALAVFSFGVPVGSAAGIALGGIVASMVDWRAAFITVGLLGLVLAPIFRLIVREPPRGGMDAVAKAEAPPSFFQVFAMLGRRRAFWLMSFGAASSSIMGYGLLFWTPSFLRRSFDFSLQEAAYFYAAILLIGGVAGCWLGGAIADKMGQKSRKAYPFVPAISFFITTPLVIFATLTTSPIIAFIALMGVTAFATAWLGPVIAAMQHFVGPHMRTTASACFLFINNIVGIGLGSLVIGVLSDALAQRFAEESLRYSILAGAAFYFLAALLMLTATRFVERDWQE
ncbi:MAG: spinster family MFS transporter [Hyphomonadaceae bacterium]